MFPAYVLLSDHGMSLLERRLRIEEKSVEQFELQPGRGSATAIYHRKKQRAQVRHGHVLNT